ncbi:hypothetical protein C8R44DRAFT_986159 [Mycena epipterygia]|nr:hypothetical protein C8R44DRAFT_986159 [Mycena epipterygia]
MDACTLEDRTSDHDFVTAGRSWDFKDGSRRGTTSVVRQRLPLFPMQRDDKAVGAHLIPHSNGPKYMDILQAHRRMPHRFPMSDVDDFPFLLLLNIYIEVADVSIKPPPTESEYGGHEKQEQTDGKMEDSRMEDYEDDYGSEKADDGEDATVDGAQKLKPEDEDGYAPPGRGARPPASLALHVTYVAALVDRWGIEAAL